MSYLSRLRKRKTGFDAPSVRGALKNFLMTHSNTGRAFGLESIDSDKEDVLSQGSNAIAAVEQDLSPILATSDVAPAAVTSEDGSTVAGTITVPDEEPTLSDAQVDAAAGVLALASDNGEGQSSLEHYMEGGRAIGDNFSVFSHKSSDVLGDRASLEQFTDHELTKYMDLSLLYNVRGQRQGRLAELFFRTTVLSPEAPYLKFELYVPNIIRNRKRAITSTKAHTYVRLLDAAIDPTLLDDRSTDAVPVYQTSGGSTVSNFVPGYPAYEVTIGEEKIETAPLALNTTVNLINLSARPGIVSNGEMDNTDGLEAAIRIKTITGQKGTGDAAQFIRFNVVNLTEMQFQGADNSTGDKVIFDFSGQFGSVTDKTSDIAGNPIFGGLAPTYEDYKIFLGTKLSGGFNLNTGIGNVNGGGAVEVLGYQAPGSTVFETQNNADIAEILGLTINGAEVRARRTNLNKRVEGTLLATLPIREAYRVELGSPLLAQLPLGVANTERAEEIATNTLITASRIRNDKLAIGKLVDTVDALESQLINSAVGTSQYVECEGVARHLIRPRVIRKAVDFDDGTVVSSLKSHERAADVSAAFTNQIRTVSTRLWFESNLESAFQFAADQGNAVKPKLAIGTSPLISQHLIVTGDTRLVGIRFDYEVVYDVDSRLENKVFMAFVSSDHQYLTFGQHLWVPELVTNLPIDRNGRSVRELQIQPRNRHLVTLPVLGVLEVTNLEKALLNPTLATIPVENIN